ncbi:ABC transporter substrate-binding protein [Microvirga makkahensis]|uniref:ABC transporter substrate-binding protein n=1 Tax=Microvirga makkahensis TaxID=1128670 RepID=A0A7X3MNC4_9HYPH|nr:ABC transporter substrate-binding protein [Microvirga makkahensis]MXQ10214.1 ABC transporter substrate-binding protein [Microvirga makkahensis]
MSRRFEHVWSWMREAALACIIACALVMYAKVDDVRAQDGSRRVLHVDSYHAGNQWNDGIFAALQETLSGKAVELRVFHMDAKRRPSAGDIDTSAQEAVRAIDEFKPDVVTISDDPAAKYLVMPYLRDAAVPVVFCGLNWDASIYGLPYRNTTGMVEVSPIPQILKLLRRHARGPRLGFLAEDTEVKRKELAYHERLFGISYDKTYFVSSHADWKEAFLSAQKEVDMLMILGVGAVPDWDLADASRLAEERSEIPSGTDFEWLTSVSLIGVVKSPEEQGRWVGQATLRILDGVQPSDIPLSYNREGELFFNDRIARRLGIKDFPPLARAVP